MTGSNEVDISMRGASAMRPAGWLALLLLAVASLAQAAPDGDERPMPDPCVEAPNLPFCR